MKIMYKVAYAENELGSTNWITLGPTVKLLNRELLIVSQK